ncbi:MAG: undecaprenyl-diphosphate phosphatase [Bacteroidia bacterium]|nr:undecaprenyl-diphosphate phosphatase [Bacteroidia bacterium]
MNLIEAVLLAITEGLTEFLPVSSTAHIMMGSAFLQIQSTPFVKFYTVCIQLGAIFSVCVMYYKRFFKTFDFYLKLFVAFLPSAVAGVLLGDYIDAWLENLLGVAIALIAGGIIFLFADKWFKKQNIFHEKELTLIQSLKVGFFQCLALFPGVSRSGATILGGRALGLSTSFSAEFSFFLAVPTMLGATVKKSYDLMKEGVILENEEVKILLMGNLVSFLIAWLAIKSFLSLLNKFGFKPFGYYRIIVGAILLLLFALGMKPTLS